MISYGSSLVQPQSSLLVCIRMSWIKSCILFEKMFGFAFLPQMRWTQRCAKEKSPQILWFEGCMATGGRLVQFDIAINVIIISTICFQVVLLLQTWFFLMPDSSGKLRLELLQIFSAYSITSVMRAAAALDRFADTKSFRTPCAVGNSELRYVLLCWNPQTRWWKSIFLDIRGQLWQIIEIPLTLVLILSTVTLLQKTGIALESVPYDFLARWWKARTP